MTMFRARRQSTRGFTLIELLVVIAIIGILAGIVLVAGGKVLTGGKRTATQDVIRVLDQSLESYIVSKGGKPGPTVKVTEVSATNSNPQSRVFPIADARDYQHANAAGSPAKQVINSVALFIYQMQQVDKVSDASKHIDGVPAKFIARKPVVSDPSLAFLPTLPTVIDAWGNPIRYVHPAFDGLIVASAGSQGADAGVSPDTMDITPLGAQAGINSIRRNYKYESGLPQGADSDGGTCIGDRPYFYSIGEDLLTGYGMTGSALAQPIVYDANADNIYTTQPTLPSSTQ